MRFFSLIYLLFFSILLVSCSSSEDIETQGPQENSESWVEIVDQELSESWASNEQSDTPELGIDWDEQQNTNWEDISENTPDQNQSNSWETQEESGGSVSSSGSVETDEIESIEQDLEALFEDMLGWFDE